MPESLDPETATEVIEAPPEPEVSHEEPQEAQSTFGWLKGYYDSAVTAASEGVDGLYYMATDYTNASPTIQSVEETVVSNLTYLSEAVSGLISSGSTDDMSQGTELKDLPPPINKAVLTTDNE